MCKTGGSFAGASNFGKAGFLACVTLRFCLGLCEPAGRVLRGDFASRAGDMADGGEAHTLRYSAFISYSHKDTAFARTLHRRLETYRLPRNLARQDGVAGPFVRRLRPIFRDRDELAASADLTASVQEAIGQASALIVVCSPAAADSVWVGREVEAFRRAHGDGPILAALIEGDEHTAFPAGLCGSRVGGGLVQPLAADFRAAADGPRLALLKLVAVLAGVRLDALVQRDAARRVRQVSVAAGSAVAGLAVMSALTWVAVDARVAAEKERNRGERLIGFMLTDLRGKLKGVGRLDLLDAVNKGALAYFGSQDLSHMAPSTLEKRAELLLDSGEDDEQRGKFSDSRAEFEEARRTTSALLLRSPNNPDRMLAHSQSEYWVGERSWGDGKPDAAQIAWTAYVDLTRKLVSIEPENVDYLMEEGEATTDMGALALRHFRDFRKAKNYFLDAKAMFQRAGAAKPKDADIRFLLATDYAWLADADRLRGDFVSAHQYRAAESKIIEDSKDKDPQNAQILAEESSNFLGTARISLEEGDFVAASDKLNKAQDIAMKLAHADPENVDRRRQERIVAIFQAQIYVRLPVSSDVTERARRILGDCSEDALLPKNEEETKFCLAVLRQLECKIGNTQRAAFIANLPLANLAQADRELSPRWGLDFYQEFRRCG
jgi:tetratricopeptide (TPR) repeat protein